jgi:drug/metabolite transporter (DMT)-like permease
MAMRILGVILLVLGILGVVYGGFSYRKETADAKVGPIEIQVTEKERVNIPLWAGILVSVAGLALVLKKP